MADASFRIEGLEEFRGAMKRFPLAVQRGARRGMRRGMFRVQRRARTQPPIPIDTGRLRASIAAILQVTSVVVRAIIGTAVEYAEFQERRRGYMDNAVREEGANVAGDIFVEITRELERLA